MSAIAKQLGIVTMGLYRHVNNKEDLLQAAAEKAFSEFDLSIPQDVSPKEQLKLWARNLRLLFLESPHLIILINRNQKLTSSWRRWIIDLARILAKTSLKGTEFSNYCQWFAMSVFSLIMLEHSASGRGGDNWINDFQLTSELPYSQADCQLLKRTLAYTLDQEAIFEYSLAQMIRILPQ